MRRMSARDIHELWSHIEMLTQRISALEEAAALAAESTGGAASSGSSREHASSATALPAEATFETLRTREFMLVDSEGTARIAMRTVGPQAWIEFLEPYGQIRLQLVHDEHRTWVDFFCPGEKPSMRIELGTLGDAMLELRDPATGAVRFKCSQGHDGAFDLRAGGRGQAVLSVDAQGEARVRLGEGIEISNRSADAAIRVGPAVGSRCELAADSDGASLRLRDVSRGGDVRLAAGGVDEGRFASLCVSGGPKSGSVHIDATSADGDAAASICLVDEGEVPRIDLQAKAGDWDGEAVVRVLATDHGRCASLIAASESAGFEVAEEIGFGRRVVLGLDPEGVRAEVLDGAGVPRATVDLSADERTVTACLRNESGQAVAEMSDPTAECVDEASDEPHDSWDDEAGSPGDTHR